LYSARDRLIRLDQVLGIFATLAEPLTFEAEPRPALFHDLMFNGKIKQIAFPRNSFAIHYVELGFLEWRRQFVLDHFDPCAIAYNRIAVFDRACAPNVEPHRGVELQRAPAGRGFGAAKHHADLLANLVYENQTSVRTRHNGGQ